tara:strand:+ start:380 stop:1810 length:1431 start_codon:yes stop_codon:yes gene_type:complete
MSNISDLLFEKEECSTVFLKASEVGERLNTPVYLVGGSVRDLLMNKMNYKDIDLMVEKDSAKFSNELAKALGVKTVIAFEKFHTYKIPYNKIEIEVAAARKETYSPDSRKPNQVTLTSVKDDLSRRDFTVNAIAVSLMKDNLGELFDPLNGIADLNKGILITPKDPDITFSDDPLRMLRAIRFATTLKFKIDDKALESIKKQSHRIKIISYERITAEIIKILSADKPSIGFYLLKETNLLEYVFPELNVMSGVEVINGHGHKDVFIHTLEVVDNAAELSDKMDIRFAALVHDIAKPPTKKYYKNKGWTFHGHEEIGRRMLRGVAKRMKLSKELRDYLMILTKLHLRPIALAKTNITDKAVRRVMYEAGEYIDDLMILCRADVTTKNKKKIAKYMNNFERVEILMADVKLKDEMKAFKCPVDGHIIMETFSLTEGRVIGIFKTRIEEAILDGDIENTYEAAYQYMLDIKDEVLNPKN